MSEIKITLWPLENLIPYELNAKKHEPEQVKRIAESIKRSGWLQPIVVDKYGCIIAGHGRRLAAMLLGPDSPTPGFAPVWVRSELDAEGVKAARLNDNRVAISDMDSEKLMLDMAGIDRELLTGIFDDKELDFLSVDHGTMNTDAFVTDMGAIVEGQKEDVERRMDNVKAQRIPLAKAFGFKDLPAADQILVTKLMAKAEALTGLQGGEAFVKWADTQLQLSA